MGLESEVETFHLRKEAEGAGRSLPCFFLILLLSYHSDLSRRQLLSVWRHSECPAAASAKACSPRTGTRVLSRSAAAADAAGDTRRRHAAARTVQVLLSTGGSDTNGTTPVYGGAAERVEGNRPSRPPPTMARARIGRRLVAAGDSRHAHRTRDCKLREIWQRSQVGTAALCYKSSRKTEGEAFERN